MNHTFFNIETCHFLFIKWDRLSILQMYTALGGVPYYWSLVDFTKSVAENVDLMFFSDNATLKLELLARSTHIKYTLKGIKQ